VYIVAEYRWFPDPPIDGGGGE